MIEVFSFMISALPWVSIGLFVACSCVLVKIKSEGKELSKLLKGICLIPTVCLILTSIIETYSENKSSGTTWLVLSALYTIINFGFIKYEKERR